MTPLIKSNYKNPETGKLYIVDNFWWGKPKGEDERRVVGIELVDAQTNKVFNVTPEWFKEQLNKSKLVKI